MPSKDPKASMSLKLNPNLRSADGKGLVRRQETKNVADKVLDGNPMYTVDDYGNRVINMEYVLDKYVNNAGSKIRFKDKPTKAIFDNLNPSSDNYKALVNANTCSLGFINFKKAKLVS